MPRRSFHGWAEAAIQRAIAGDCSIALASDRQFAALNSRPPESGVARLWRIAGAGNGAHRRIGFVRYSDLGNRGGPSQSAVACDPVLGDVPFLAAFSGHGHGFYTEP